MSWFRHRPRTKQPEKQVPHRTSPLQEKHFEKLKQQQEEMPSKKTDKE